MNKVFFGVLVVMFVFASKSYAMEEREETTFTPRNRQIPEQSPLMILAQYEQNHGRPEKALSIYNGLLALNELTPPNLPRLAPQDEAKLLYQKGLALKILKKYEDALVTFKAAKKLNNSSGSSALEGKDRAMVQVEIGKIHINLDKPRKALKVLNMALTMKNPNPKNANALQYDDRQHTKQMLKKLYRIIDLLPSQQNALQNPSNPGGKEINYIFISHT
ncbi:MAG: hypothetical protein BGO67_09470 [Alphaproteobacteria bacterium 41-28]|nr:MAG: hypothetical protein BGO67_09470 [Alphaproteobacteria bacterium 41-28]